MKQKQYKKTMKTIKELIDLLDMESEMVHGLEEEIEDLNVHIHTLHKHIADLEVENTCLEIEKEVLLHKNRDAFFDALDAAERDGFVPSYSGGVNAQGEDVYEYTARIIKEAKAKDKWSWIDTSEDAC